MSVGLLHFDTFVHTSAILNICAKSIYRRVLACSCVCRAALFASVQIRSYFSPLSGSLLVGVQTQIAGLPSSRSLDAAGCYLYLLEGMRPFFSDESAIMTDILV